jgi:ureidoglycolate dehydrogenase (NAD+)
MAEYILIPYQRVLQFCNNILLQAGLDTEQASVTAEAICSASLRGIDSHGIRLLPHYLEAIEKRRINPEAEFHFKQTSMSTGILDANHGIAHAAVAKAMDHAIELAIQTGTGFVSVKNSNHCGAMSYYAMRACEKDMIGIACTNASPKLRVFNSTKPYFGINPICFAAPIEGEEPFCYDAAPSVISNNKIKMLAEKGEILPSQVAADENGKMTLDPVLSKMLIPLGGTHAGYKGYAMAMIVDIMCSLLSGMPNGKDVSMMYQDDGGQISDKRYLGQFVGAFRIDVFEEVSEFKRRLKETANEVRALPRSDEALDEVMIPGDPEKRTKAKRLQEGIPLSSSLIITLNNIAERYQLEMI